VASAYAVISNPVLPFLISLNLATGPFSDFSISPPFFAQPQVTEPPFL